jgi:hypothetical protein
MTWHVQYRQAGTNELLRRLTPEAAIEAACRLIDQGCDVYAIGTESLTDSITHDEITRIYAILDRERHPFGKAPRRGLEQLGSSSDLNHFAASERSQRTLEEAGPSHAIHVVRSAAASRVA